MTVLAQGVMKGATASQSTNTIPAMRLAPIQGAFG